MYREKLRSLVIKGLLGFALGVIFAFIRSPELSLGFALLIGLLFAGLPYGWQLSGKIVGDLFVIGNIGIMLIAFVLRAMLALITGLIAFPIVLVSTFIKSRNNP